MIVANKFISCSDCRQTTNHANIASVWPQ